MTYSNADVQTYDYDPMGNRTAKTHNSVPSAYSYDDADQMTLAGGVAYAYDDNGNQIEAGTDTFEWDAENRLIATNIASTTGTYDYNGDGLRTTRAIGASAVSYAWDLNASLPVILQDTDGNRYVYGFDLLTRIDGTGEEWYLYDGLGSTTGLADDTGAVTGTYEYDVFGAERVHTGDATEWSYTGEQHDSTGLEYLRARYYDAGTGRFLAQDPLPLLQRYPYVANNPVTRVDPTGLRWDFEVEEAHRRACQRPGAPQVSQCKEYESGSFDSDGEGVVGGVSRVNCWAEAILEPGLPQEGHNTMTYGATLKCSALQRVSYTISVLREQKGLLAVTRGTQRSQLVPPEGYTITGTITVGPADEGATYYVQVALFCPGCVNEEVVTTSEPVPVIVAHIP